MELKYNAILGLICWCFCGIGAIISNEIIILGMGYCTFVICLATSQSPQSHATQELGSEGEGKKGQARADDLGDELPES